MKKGIKHEFFFKQPVQEVWDYLTRPELIEQWLMKADFKPVVGHRFQFVCNNVTDCEVLEVVPLKLLSYSWVVKNVSHEKKVDSKVTWTLSEKDGGTELFLQHDGFKVLDDLLQHNEGWVTCMATFGNLIMTAQNADA